MGETPEGPMPNKKGKSEGGQIRTIPLKYYKQEYDMAADLVRMLRGLGVFMHAKCPRCGAEGSVSVVETKNGYKYLVIRHPDGGTHTVPKTDISAILKELCEVKKDLEYVLKRYKEYEEEGGVKFCAEGRK